MKKIIHFLIIILLTITTQIGGLIYLISLISISKHKSKYKLKRFLVFIFIYLISTFFIIPKLAPKFGRVKIQNTSNLEAHNFFTIICNRNYVKPKLNSVLISVSKEISKELPNIKITYLDANFPFFNGFPLLPHLSHNDGKKIDISFIYEDHNKKLTNLKPSNSGYGIFVEPHNKEINQSKICKDKGFLQYDFTKYLTFGSNNKKVRLSNYATKKLINTIVENKKVSKLFIEPHLKLRLKVNNSKIRFHGCKAVRHDDHIHFQIK